jgi:hypothetical protein
MANQDDEIPEGPDCVVPAHPIPVEELGRYSIERDPHREKDIADYVEIEARGETVKHVEKVKEEVIIGEQFEVWDVTTDKDRWWVITNLTNLYSHTAVQNRTGVSCRLLKVKVLSAENRGGQIEVYRFLL